MYYGQTDYEAAIRTLYGSANENGLIPTLHAVFKHEFIVKIPLSSKACAASIDELELSVRAQNCLKRAGIMTIEKLADIAGSEELLKLRNLGKKSYTEIKTKLLVFGYSALSESGKMNFWREILRANVSELFNSGSSYRQVEAMTRISKSTLIRARVK